MIRHRDSPLRHLAIKPTILVVAILALILSGCEKKNTETERVSFRRVLTVTSKKKVFSEIKGSVFVLFRAQILFGVVLRLNAI